MSEKVAIVTGGASGIGLAVVEEFLSQGCHVVIADINEDAACTVAKKLGDQCFAIGLDITNEEAVIAAIQDIKVRYGRIDFLINNAGISDSSADTIDQDYQAFQKVLSVSLNATFLLSREVAKVMMAQGNGAIVNLSSIVGFVGLRKRNAYGAAKAGIVAMTRSMACEWASSGIRVNAVAPGYVKTDLVARMIEQGMVDEDRVSGRTPLGRLAQPSEIAEPIAFLCSESARYITGTCLMVDGGWCAFGEPGAV